MDAPWHPRSVDLLHFRLAPEQDAEERTRMVREGCHKRMRLACRSDGEDRQPYRLWQAMNRAMERS